MAPQMPRPAPSAMTRVWSTPTAELKNAIVIVCRNLWDEWPKNLALTAKAGTKTAMQLPIPTSPFNFYLISMIRSDPASEEASFNRRYIYEKPPLLRRRAC